MIIGTIIALVLLCGFTHFWWAKAFKDQAEFLGNLVKEANEDRDKAIAALVSGNPVTATAVLRPRTKKAEPVERYEIIGM